MKKINFIHIPKTAGLSFFYFLEECFGKTKCVRFGSESQVKAFHDSNSVEIYSNLSVLSGHLTCKDFSDKGLINPNRVTIAFVRDPYLREISAFKYYYKTQHTNKRDNVTNALGYYFNKSPLCDTQSSYLAYSSKVKFTDFFGSNIYIFPISYLGLVSVEIKRMLNVSYFPALVNESDKGFSNYQNSEIEKYVNNYVGLNRTDDIDLFKEATFFAPVTLSSFVDSLS